MSVEMHVFFRGKLPDKKALSGAMAELGFPLTIAAGSLERQRGFMPMRLRREETGVEFDVFDDRAAVEELGGKHIDPAFGRSANFRWGGDEDEMLAGLCAAAALAKLVNGMVFDAEAAKLLSVDEAIARAQEALRSVRKPDATPRRGTRPADLKRYLKSLLKQRSDLALIGRLLVIRPVRHVLRGVVLDRTSGKYRLVIQPNVKPLWDSPNGRGYSGGLQTREGDVWQPHFEPLLMDALAQDIFEPVGGITMLDDVLATLSSSDRLNGDHVIMLALAGERDRVAEEIESLEIRDDPGNPHVHRWFERLRGYIAGDVDGFCARYHAFEARTVEARKLAGIWEPSPFPAELPATERKQVAEPSFVTTPWIARPPWLLGNIPEKPGDVGFAKDWLRRKGDLTLVVPLSRDEAEERHRNVEEYLLAARLSDGCLLLLAWGGLDRNNPGRKDGQLYDWYPRHPMLNLYGAHFRAEVMTRPDTAGDDRLSLGIVHVYERATWKMIWQWSFDSRKDETEFVRDGRQGEVFYRNELTDADIDRLSCPMPNFGEFDALVELVRALLRSRGYGEIT
jgi:hypothetical protein